MAAGLEVKATLPDGLSYPDFDKRVLKKHLRPEAKKLAARTKSLVSKRGVSPAGAYPGLDSGALKNAVGYKVSRSGFSFWIYEQSKKFTKTLARVNRRRAKKGRALKKSSVFYPAIVVFGHGRAAGRKNWVVGAANDYLREWMAVSQRILLDAVKPARMK